MMKYISLFILFAIAGCTTSKQYPKTPQELMETVIQAVKAEDESKFLSVTHYQSGDEKRIRELFQCYCLRMKTRQLVEDKLKIPWWEYRLAFKKISGFIGFDTISEKKNVTEYSFGKEFVNTLGDVIMFATESEESGEWAGCSQSFCLAKKNEGWALYFGKGTILPVKSFSKFIAFFEKELKTLQNKNTLEDVISSFEENELGHVLKKSAQ